MSNVDQAWDLVIEDLLVIGSWSLCMPDLYSFFRWLVFIFVTVYVTATTAQFLWSWYQFLITPDRYIGLLRSYLIVHGLRIRFRAFGGDVLVCILLSVAFLLMWRCHVQLDAIARVQAELKR